MDDDKQDKLAGAQDRLAEVQARLRRVDSALDFVTPIVYLAIVAAAFFIAAAIWRAGMPVGACVLAVGTPLATVPFLVKWWRARR